MPGRLNNSLATIMNGNWTLVPGSFVTVASGDPTVLTGEGFSVVRDGAGEYTVTVTNAQGFVAILTDVALETPGSVGVTFVDQDSITNDDFQIELHTTADASATDFAADDDAGSVISFLAVVAGTT